LRLRARPERLGSDFVDQGHGGILSFKRRVPYPCDGGEACIFPESRKKMGPMRPGWGKAPEAPAIFGCYCRDQVLISTDWRLT
jgi:hypothetical protein